MKTRLTFLSGSTLGLLLLIGAATTPGHAQSAPNLVTVTPTSPSGSAQSTLPVPLGPASLVRDVEKLTQSGADPAVIKGFIQAWKTPYSVTANDILHLHDVGVSSDTLTTLLQHQNELNYQTPAPGNPGFVTAPSPAPAPYPPAANQPSVAVQPAPEQYVVPQATYPVDAGVYSYPVYPAYDYSYYYGYPYYYSPGISIGLGFGFRGYRGGYGGHYGGYGGHGGFAGHGGGFGGHGGGFSGHGGGGHR